MRTEIVNRLTLETQAWTGLLLFQHLTITPVDDRTSPSHRTVSNSLLSGGRDFQPALEAFPTYFYATFSQPRSSFNPYLNRDGDYQPAIEYFQPTFEPQWELSASHWNTIDAFLALDRNRVIQHADRGLLSWGKTKKNCNYVTQNISSKLGKAHESKRLNVARWSGLQGAIIAFDMA